MHLVVGRGIQENIELLCAADRVDRFETSQKAEKVGREADRTGPLRREANGNSKKTLSEVQILCTLNNTAYVRSPNSHFNV